MEVCSISLYYLTAISRESFVVSCASLIHIETNDEPSTPPEDIDRIDSFLASCSKIGIASTDILALSRAFHHVESKIDDTSSSIDLTARNSSSLRESSLISSPSRRTPIKQMLKQQQSTSPTKKVCIRVEENNYQLGKSIGRGSFGTVYMALNLNSGLGVFLIFRASSRNQTHTIERTGSSAINIQRNCNTKSAVASQHRVLL
jgi:hypothetical protein